VRPGGIQVTFDCADPQALATFWSGALGYAVPDNEAMRELLRQAGVWETQLDDFRRIDDPDQVGPTLYFQRVPEPKAGKNRVHLDVRAPRDGTGEGRNAKIDAEAERMVALGATRLHVVADELGYFWVMQDPEGNEFCVD
jgi:hypothetical protein